MIRAHLATYPPRRSLMLDVVARMTPQVDRLFVILNEYDTVPAELEAFANVLPILPPRDLKDAGKFLPEADADDEVFLIDDDIAYPPDYVARTRDLTSGCDLDGNVFAYQGNALVMRDGKREVESYMFRLGHDAISGAGLIGTGTLYARGRNLPPLDFVESAAGFVDVRYCRWLHETGILPWVLPREKRWMRPTLPKHMKPDSLFQKVHRGQPELYMAEFGAFFGRWPHMGQPYPWRESGAR